MIFSKPLPKILSLMGLLVSVSACSSTGDFGRVRNAPPSFLDQRPGSDLQGNLQIVQTDEEKQMRRSGQRFVSTFDDNSWLSRIRFTANALAGEYPNEADYYRWLRSQPFGASSARYGALENEVTTDSMTLPAAFFSICAVQQTDSRRAIAAQSLTNVEPETLALLAQRRQENNQYISEFIAVIGFRYDSYSYALEHLLVETPHEAARRVDNKLNTLAVQVQVAQANQFCSTPAG